jgi:hypothetical protein
MTDEEKRIFFDGVRALAVGCSVPQFRCEIFDHNGVPGDVFAVGQDASWPRDKRLPRNNGDGRCGPGGAAALLRSMAALLDNKALRNAARLTFDTDEQFERMFPPDPRLSGDAQSDGGMR